MRSVTLVYLPGSNYLIGTFNPTLNTGWWISDGFIGVETVEKGMQIYGSIFIAICKKINGDSAIYRSEDYGRTWSEVFTTSGTLYDMVRIVYGRVLLNASDGFYETVNSGITWTKICDLPGGTGKAALCNVGFGDMLFCTDSYKIWKSTNLGRKWIHCGHLWHSKGYPAIAGANGVILCADGSYISQSVDNGDTWEDDKYWSTHDNGVVYPEPSYHLGNFIIKQIIVSAVQGPYVEDVMFVVRFDDTTNTWENTTTLYSRTWTGYFSIPKRAYAVFSFRFKQIASPFDNTNQLDTYELPVTGNSDYTDRVVICASSKQRSDGTLYPSIKKSVDGGWNWTSTDLSLVEFELSADNTSTVLDDSYAKSTFVYGDCLNWGYWAFVGDTHQRRLQSYDYDWIMQSYETMEATYDMRVKIEPPAIISIEYDMGLYALGRHLVPMLHDSLIEVTLEKPYLNTLILEQEHETSYQVDEITEVYRTLPYEMIIWLEKTSHKPYVMSYHTEVSSSTTYAMTAWFGQVTVPDIDWASPQWWNLIFPDSNRPPLDSRGVY